MASFTTSPNMALQIPTIGVEPGPQYATDVNNSLTIIDGHNHSAGSGVLITPSGLNINSDLPINGNNLTLIFSSRFQSLVSPIANSSPNIGCIYVSGNELYYNDFSGGHQVQITNNGSVNAGAGSITGLPSGTASVSFASGTYVFQSATNVAATLDGASLILRNTTPSSFGLTLSPPNALGSNYTVTLPALPGVTSVMTLTTSGNMGSVTYDQVGENMTVVGANAILATSTNGNLGGNAAQENGLNLVVSNANAAASLSILRGAIASGGGTISGEGWTVGNPSAGVWNITFSTPFADTPTVVATCYDNAVTGQAYVNAVFTFGCTIHTIAGSFANVSFNFIVVGQRA
jgi:hypothetical protein